MKKLNRIYIEITNICNLKCVFCTDTNRKKEFMKLEDFRIILNKIKNYTNLIMLHIKGEPLMHPDLYKILDECKKSGILVNITTNTTLLMEKKDILAKSKALRQINLSMHAFDQNQLSVKENCKIVFSAIKDIKKENPNLIISYRLWNINSLKENDDNFEILSLLGEEYHIKDIISKSKENNFIELGNKIFLNQDIEFKWPDINGKVISKKGKCYGLKKQIGILVNGDVVPCCFDQNGEIKLGNIFENSLEEIMHSQKAKKIVKGFNNGELVEELCQRCGFVHTRIC